MAQRKYRIKVPSGISSKNEDIESPIAFKNMTNDVAFLYWIDHSGRARLYADLSPVDRSNIGLRVKTFQTHPWVAIQGGRRQLLMNGKRYFLPPNPNTWKCVKNGWLQNQWILPNDNDGINIKEESDDQKDDQFYEVIISEPGCATLRNLCLLRCCQLYSTKELINMSIPKSLSVQLELTKQRYFYKLSAKEEA